MNSPQTAHDGAFDDARLHRFGRQVAARLTEQGAALPHDMAERLRFAREQALARAAHARAAAARPAAATATATATTQMGTTLALNGGGNAGSNNPLWPKLVSLLPLLALLAGLLLMQRGQLHEQLIAAAELDTALLSDKLPPAAFSDPGFAEYLRDGGDGEE